MKIGIIGSGVLGQTIGAKLVERGEDVVLGTRSPQNVSDKRGHGKSLEEWLKATGNKARVGTFADAAAHGEIVINATSGTGSLEALGLAGGDHDLFASGNDAAAKARVTELLRQWFGWRNVIDLGDITTARGAEMLMPIWLRLWGALGTPMFNFRIAR
jgi:predicted dinucleotide-binding enzyme